MKAKRASKWSSLVLSHGVAQGLRWKSVASTCKRCLPPWRLLFMHSARRLLRLENRRLAIYSIPLMATELSCPFLTWHIPRSYPATTALTNMRAQCKPNRLYKMEGPGGRLRSSPTLVPPLRRMTFSNTRRETSRPDTRVWLPRCADARRALERGPRACIRGRVDCVRAQLL